MAVRNTEWVRFDWPLGDRNFVVPLADGYGLRPADEADLETMRKIVAAAYDSDPQWDGMTGDIERRVMARVTERIADPTAYFLLMVHDDRVVGLNGVALASETNMNLFTGICVDPGHQGRGLAVALLAGTLAWLRDNGLRKATVTTAADAIAAKVYNRFGAIRTTDVPFPDAPVSR